MTENGMAAPTRERRSPLALLTTLVSQVAFALLVALPLAGQQPETPKPTKQEPKPAPTKPAAQDPPAQQPTKQKAGADKAASETTKGAKQAGKQSAPTPKKSGEQARPQQGAAARQGPDKAGTKQPGAIKGQGNAAKAKPNKSAPAKTAANKPAPQQPKSNEPPLPLRRLRQFTTPDGSRFVLVSDPAIPNVEWSIASWADGRDDPEGLPGVAMAAVQASLAGTWTTGSKNPDAERAALAKLDEAWQRKLASNEPGLAAKIVQLDKAAAQLADERMFARVLAAAPAHQPRITSHDGIAVMSLTTIEAALPKVANLLFERREQQALRGLARRWMPELIARMQTHALTPHRRLQAEVVALMMPLSPANDRFAAPASRAPTREQALETWRRSQHPTRTVHVLLGRFELKRTAAMLEQVFASTSLGEPPSYRRPPLRPLGASRRSVVAGVPGNRTYLAWVMPPIKNQFALELAIAWLHTAPASPLTKKLAKARPGIQVHATAPWPRDESGRGLLLLEVIDPSGKPGLADEVIAACRACAGDAKSAKFWAARTAVAANWIEQTESARGLAAIIAQRALLWPDQKTHITGPRYAPDKAALTILQRVFATKPAIVESKR